MNADKAQVQARVVETMHKALVLLLAVAFLAGCTDAKEDVEPIVEQPVLDDALALFLAGNASANIVRLGSFDTGSAEVDACNDLVFADMGNTIHILDVHDPTNIVEVATFNNGHSVEDVKVSADCQWMFLGNDEEGSNPQVHELDLPAPLPVGEGGFYVVDISDPTNPTQVSSLGVGPRRGPHMVYYHNTSSGRELVFGANADIAIAEFDRASGTLTELARYQADLVTAFNRDPQVFDVLYQGWAHDMFVMEDPVANTTLMFVANWDAGLRIVDLADPSNPVELGGWNDFPDGHEGNLHTVATEWIGDRRITVGTVEVGFAVVGGYHYAMGTDRSILYVWDTTDPANIVLLGEWENPNGEPSGRDNVPGESVSSTHNFQLEQGRVYLAHYALGVFVLDVSTHELQAAPKLLAYHQEPGDSVWDVILNDGVMYSAGGAGLIALHYTPDVLGPLGIDSRA